MTTSISPRALAGFSNSTDYDAHRPTYSPTIIEHLLSNIGVSGRKSARIVDLAAGTGKLTEALARREEGFEIIAVEPHAEMREVLVKKELEGVRVVEGRGESMPAVESGSVDAVVVGQAFHWFANLTALKEIHRVLRRHSALGMVWNAEDWNSPREHMASTPWEQSAQDLNFQSAKDVGDHEPRFRHMKWREVFDEQIKKTPLSLLVAGDDLMFSLPVAEHQEAFEVALTPERAWNRYCTLGHIAALEREQKARVHQAFTDAIENAEKNENGEVIVHGTTFAYWTSKVPEQGREGLADGPDAEPV